MTTEFAASIGDESIRVGAAKSLGSVFGSGFVSGTPMVAADLVDPSLRPAATTLVAFDAFIHNIDRRAENPNLFLDRNEAIAFDHGDAFARNEHSIWLQLEFLLGAHAAHKF